MKWIVAFNEVKKTAEVEAEDRWEAFKKALEYLKIDTKGMPLSAWFNLASVQKKEKKKRLSWWEK